MTKLSRVFVALLVTSLMAAAVFSQVDSEAKKAFLKWKQENVGTNNAGSFQGVGFSLTQMEKGVKANFYAEFGKDISGLRATKFIAQPVSVTKDENGKWVTVDIGAPFSMQAVGGILLEKGSIEDHILTPSITFLAPLKANAVRLTVQNMFGENGNAQIILGIAPEGTRGVIGTR
ncbi:MAG TPA: hypothetical protein VGO50_09660 [Pyrinomonadaceae bacterium]|jgi:hypothetical protein|nr:hypothetical protein [Pyrinomonadaceae bacterium]